jgi:hypothetical protein
MESEECLMKKSVFVYVLFTLIIVYSVSSIVVLLLALGLVPLIHGVYLNPQVLIIFALVSFILTIAISVYHLSTVIRRRKRKTDLSY